jgi:hypothetical protein
LSTIAAAVVADGAVVALATVFALLPHAARNAALVLAVILVMAARRKKIRRLISVHSLSGDAGMAVLLWLMGQSIQ